MGKPNTFFGIEITHGKHGVILSQRKYILDLLEGTEPPGCKHASSLMDTDSDLWFEDGLKILHNIAGKLIYLTITRSDIAFVVGLVSRLIHKPKEIH